MNILITGGSGFIGSHVVRAALAKGHTVLNYDALTYAANPLTLAGITGPYRFVHGDITDGALLAATLRDFKPAAVIHCAAESHVDRSIDSPAPFIHTNVLGTQIVLEAALAYWKSAAAPQHFRLLHISTDEVFGSIPDDTAPVREDAAYNPSSPYAASKAAADHLARAWRHTYGLPVIITNCGNNYGPCQYPEKLIPHIILRALKGEKLPVYGTGDNIRDWIHAGDHADALLFLLEKGAPGHTYLIGANTRLRNIDLVHRICACLDTLAPANAPYCTLIEHVDDRPGHDHRYAVDPAKINALGWAPKHGIETALQATVQWYLDNPGWVASAYETGYTSTRIGQREKSA